MIRRTIATRSDYKELMSYVHAVVQFARTVENGEGILTQTGASPGAVVRSRIYLTDAADRDPPLRARSIAFDPVRPTRTMMQVARLIDPHMQVKLGVTMTLPAPVTFQDPERAIRAHPPTGAFHERTVLDRPGNP
ncbi:Rid family hydrolase [Celeribacter indicus]|uniref:Endoribonuclease L-PSP n=1 Tax=Celeribacter indicus TaxID=1208324 RepID=A0A0B5E6V1_9RHOB|nr:Rid family hydrolase [Celeribacter indicus]AJE48731.1 endoribonuclease L-PSP [Celeribacter indicus]SDX11903.1 Enamine deaminase RidA, house cleaning of reactive enamine intermediates, YjgF/YER057c/UK114 family [Celeribacter indicus]